MILNFKGTIDKFEQEAELKRNYIKAKLKPILL